MIIINEWLRGVMYIALRWETLVVGPTITLKL
jgi:hypothetical protein